MARYIDADAMKDGIIKLRRTLDIDKCSNDFACGWVIGVDNMEGLIDRQPTADVVEVVRCKNCIHKVDYCGRLMCGRQMYKFAEGVGGLVATLPEHFCSYGERKL